MDFYSLSRKELQTLCKRNKIPANITNLAMADALAALPQVEGLDEFLNPVETDTKQFREEKVMGTPDIHHSRTSTRRKDVNVAVVTPVMRSVSTRRNKKEAQIADDEKPIDHMPKTPAAPSTVTRPYNTRRSVRLLEKNLSKMSLMDSGDTGVVKFDDNVSWQTQDSLEAEPHYSKLKLEASSETCNDSIEVCDGSDFDLNKPIGKEGHADNKAEPMLLDSFDSTEPENKKCMGTMQDAPIEASEDASMEVTNQDIAAFSLSVEVPDDASMDVAGQDIVSSLPMSSVSKTDNQGGDDSAVISALSSEVSEAASMEVTTDHDVVALTVEVTDQDVSHVTSLSSEIPDDASMEATDEDIAASLPMSSVCDYSVSLKDLVACNTDNHDVHDHTEISDASVCLPSCNINTLVDSNVIPEEIAIPKQESSISVETMKHNQSPSKVLVGNTDEVSFSTMIVAPIYEQKSNEIQIQSIVPHQFNGESYSPAESEPKDVADEHIQEDENKNEFYIMKENPLQNMSMRELRKMVKKLALDEFYVADEHIQEDENKNEFYIMKENPLQNMSMRALRKMVKKLALDGKSNSKSNNVAKEMDRKRTALQALPKNQMTDGEAQNDG